MARGKSCPNPVFLKVLEDYRTELKEKQKNPEQEDHRVANIAKAIFVLKNHPEELTTPRDCQQLKSFGPWMISILEKGLAQAGSAGESSRSQKSKSKKTAATTSADAGSSSSQAGISSQPKPRGRPKKKQDDFAYRSSSPDMSEFQQRGAIVVIPRAAPKKTPAQKEPLEWDPYSVEIPPPASSSRNNGAGSGSVSRAPRFQSTAQPSMRREAQPSQGAGHSVNTAGSSNQDRVFHFWYIDTDQNRVDHFEQAEVIITDDMKLLYSIQYLAELSSHPTARQLFRSRPAPFRSGRPQTLLAAMSEFLVEKYPQSNAPTHSSTTSNLGPLGACDNNVASSSSMAGQKRKADDGASSLADLLAQEASSKRMTLDTSKVAAHGTGVEENDLKGKGKATTAPSARSTVSDADELGAHMKGRNKTNPDVARSNITDFSEPEQRQSSGASFNRIKSTPNPITQFSSLSATASVASSSRTTASTTIGRTVSLPTARGAVELQPTLLHTAARRAAVAHRPRVSSHIPPPPAIDNQLERFLNGEDDDKDNDEPQFILPFRPRIVPAHSYDIIFVLDSREVQTSKKGEDRLYIQSQLAKKGLQVETRALELGDMLWLAIDRQTGEEWVLDFIVERKRIDDLVGSIKDGRFHEQKFRLKQSGIGRVYYLVEEYDAAASHKHMDKSVFTALSSTQIIEGFFLKETRNLEDTIDYVVGLHSTIVEMYQNKAIHAIPDEMIKRHTYMALQTQLHTSHPATPYHTSYTAYRELNKSGTITLKDAFARMLLCIRGMSAEKAATVLEHYDTPNLLWCAFKDAEIQEVQERAEEEAELAANPPKGKGKRKSKVVPAKHMLTKLEALERRQIKPALAESVYNLFMAEVY